MNLFENNSPEPDDEDQEAMITTSGVNHSFFRDEKTGQYLSAKSLRDKGWDLQGVELTGESVYHYWTRPKH